MKWLNVITQTENDDELFSEILYELFDSQEELETYSQSTKQIQNLFAEKKSAFDDSMAKLEKYVKKSKKPVEQVYSVIPNETNDGFIFSAVDPKVSDTIEIVNNSLKYVNTLDKYLHSSYSFTHSDVENLPELLDIPTPIQRFVYSIPFNSETSWNKLSVPAELRRSFVIAMALNRMSEQIM